MKRSLISQGYKVYICLLAWVAIQATPFSHAQEPTRTDGSEIGIAIMGSIVKEHGTPDDNVALIKESNGKVRAVKKDHIIHETYKVVAVTAQHLDLVTREGKRYLVYQDKFSQQGSGKIAATPAVMPPSFQEEYREEGFERSKGQIVMTGMYRDKLVKEDLAKILMQATAEPHMEDGQIVGFKLSQIDEGSIYAKSGLQNGDVVTSINGQELNNVANSIKLLQTLKGADQIDIELRRGSTTSKISINVR